ncbi:hypothetical protein [Zhongshania antarctica]
MAAAAKKRAYPLQLNYQDGYDHSYYFIASFHCCPVKEK